MAKRNSATKAPAKKAAAAPAKKAAAAPALKVVSFVVFKLSGETGEMFLHDENFEMLLHTDLHPTQILHLAEIGIVEEATKAQVKALVEAAGKNNSDLTINWETARFFSK